LVVLAVAALAPGCGGGDSLTRTQVAIETAGGEVVLDVEVADSREERARGLMGRESLPETAGMLFVYPEDSRARFWMKDTLIPLSIAFLSGEGRILAILDMEPCSVDKCPLYDAEVPYRMALEVNRGTFERIGSDVGDLVRIED
jgi:uncharacterized membrane protein (UPF0127 family)